FRDWQILSNTPHAGCHVVCTGVFEYLHENESIHHDIRERLADNINRFFVVQSVQSDAPVSLLDRLLLSMAFTKMSDQTVTKKRIPHAIVLEGSLKAGAQKMVLRRFGTTTITPFLSSSLLLSPVGFSSLLQMFDRQQFWIKPLQKNAPQNLEYSVNTKG
ncbi:hypothetical protein, partial [Kistimonas scapharcae]|uniref:hypothetical protein n=1 Tax=Kistimonas scapharcae TaxID=1036133 RepID=UPI0031EE6B26